MLYNEDFGKLVERSLEYAPLNILYKNVWYCPAPESILRKCGYKEIVDTPCPKDEHEYAYSWKETDTQIIKIWAKVPDPTPAQKREKAYQEELICRYGNGVYTVDFMNKLWWEYSAEGNRNRAKEIKEIIAEAKADIRERYPDKD